MCKKTIFYSILSVCMALAFAFTAQAQVSIGVSIQPFPDAGSHPCTDQLVTNQVYDVTVYASNSSFSGSPANQIPVYLEGEVTENDACTAVGCPAGSEVPGAIGFISCTPLDACISNCQETAPGTGIVTFDVAPGCLLLAAGQQFRQLVSITKQALIPSLAGVEDCTLPSDFGKYNMAAKCLDNIATQGVDCQVRDPQTGQTGTGSGTSEVYFPPAPCIDVTKDCEPDLGCIGGDITFTGTVTNCGDIDLINLSVVDNKGSITGGTCGSILPAGQSCTYSGIYTAPIVIGGNTDTVTATGSTTQGAQVSDQASATCTKEVIPPEINVVKECVDAPASGGNITYTVTVTNTTPATCNGTPWNEVLNCTATDNNPGVQYNESLTFTLNPGETKNFTGIYSCPALSCPETLSVPNTFSVVCNDSIEQTPPATDSDDATCNCPCEGEEICRTPGFWGTHAGTEKNRSQNITQAVINKVGSLTVCGETIDDTSVGSCDSAVEAICVSVKGEGQRQLVRQLTAAALNCVMSSGNADCSGVSIDQIFADCNNVCQGGTVEGWDISKCIGAIDCFNNGGNYNNGFCQTGTCSDNGAPCSEDNLENCGVSNGFLAFLNGVSCVPLEGNCHERELCNEDIGLCFEPPGPAGSSRACTEARGNSLYVAEGSCTE
jgi:hypothetical protein